MPQNVIQLFEALGGGGGHASSDTLHPMNLECCVGMIVKYTQVGTDC